MTLLREIDERTAAVKKQNAEAEAKKHADSQDTSKNRDITGEVDIDRGYAILVGSALFLVHTTLAIIARAQYNQPIELSNVLKESGRAFPFFIVLIYLFHPFTSKLYQSIGFIASTFSGCYIVNIFNTEGYYASMSKVPAIGALWVWLFIELEWYYGPITLSIVGAYTYFSGFSIM